MKKGETLSEFEEFVRNAYLSKSRHFHAATRHTAFNSWIGVPAVLINIALGSVLFRFLGEAIPKNASWIAASLALVAALLTGIQTFFNFSRMSDGHRRIGNRYTSVQKKAELLIAKFKDGLIDLQELSEEFDALFETYKQINLDGENFPTGKRDFHWALGEEHIRTEGKKQRTPPKADPS